MKTGIAIEAHHLPPGTKQVEQDRAPSDRRLYRKLVGAYLLVSYQVIAGIRISATTTSSTGSRGRCELDANTYPKGVFVPGRRTAALQIERAAFHGEWKDTYPPHQPVRSSCLFLTSAKSAEGRQRGF